jgi:hypothetical protein
MMVDFAAVISSAAKQSIGKQSWIASSQALLAMTKIPSQSLKDDQCLYSK